MACSQSLLQEYNKPAEVYFCESSNCTNIISENILSSTKVDCALYSLTADDVIKALKEKNARVIVDDDNLKKLKEKLNVRTDQARSLMHNKFCILDEEKVITGSFNPTKTKQDDANNLLIFHSKILAKNYEEEFEEIWSHKRQKSVVTGSFVLNDNLLENYFCPEDNCKDHIYYTLKSASKSIKFITYSFTDNKIGDLLLDKSKDIEVKGIFSSTQNSDFSQYNKLKEFSKKSKKIHDKVFIIDDETVVTGSYNPTTNGDKKNDENILIIHDKEIAKKYVSEFEKLWLLSST